MASCSFNSNGRTFTLSVVEESYSIENNTSNIRWTITISGGDSGTYYDSYCKATVNGSVVYNQTKGWSSGAFPAKDGSVTGTISNIAHDSVGKASVSFALEGYSYVYTTKYASGSLQLTTIPRATPAPSISCDVESSTSFTLSPYSSQFSHSIQISFGGTTKYLYKNGTLSNSEVIYSNTSGLTWNFVADTSYYSKFTGKSATGKIIVKTYSGSSLIGSQQEGTLTIIANQSICSPIITGSVVDVNEKTIALTGDEHTIIKYVSTPRLTTSIQPSNKNDTNTTLSYLQIAGSTITDLSKRVFDIQSPTQNSFLVKAINSRTYLTETPIKATGSFINYILPTITIVSLKRKEPTTGDVVLSYKGDYFNDKFSSTQSNVLTIAWYYKEKNASDWTLGGNLTPTLKDGSNTFSEEITIESIFNYQKQYDFKISIDDKLSSNSTTKELPRGFPIFWWGENFVDILGEFRINGNKVSIPTIYNSKTTSTTDTYSATYINNLHNISYCKMNTNFDSKTISNEVQITGWENYQENGDLGAYPSRNRLEIKNTSLALITGKISGENGVSAYLKVTDSDNNNVFENGQPGLVLIQPSGNGYWSTSFPTMVVPLDKTKTYYVTMYASGYSNGSTATAYINSGFGALGTNMSAVKLM